MAGGRKARIGLAVAAGLALAGCLAVTSRQLQYWHDSVALFSHAIAVTENNSVAQCNLGEALVQRGKSDDALVHLNTALALRPGYPEALNNKAMVLSRRGRTDEAIALLQQVLAEEPHWSGRSQESGQVLLDKGRTLKQPGNFKR